MKHVAQGIALALTLALAGFAWRLIWLHYATETIAQATSQMQHDMQLHAVDDARMRAEQHQRELQARALSSNEQCVAGTVVRIEASSYTQASGVDGRPVKCAGRYRLR